MGRARTLIFGVIAIGLAACDKVPIVDVNARFALAEVTWFEEEETLFVFYRGDADQGLGPETQIELMLRTDHFELPWTPVSQLLPVHTHVPVDCGTKSVCGSTSIALAERPVEVRMRLRYHRDGGMTLDAPVSLHTIGRGPAHTNRSLLVYGVFDESNTHVQWRARHQFPSLRNQEAEKLGLRRHFTITDRRHGEYQASYAENPYGYASAASCPEALWPVELGPVETSDRAVFDLAPLPQAAFESSIVCARSTVTDARGTFDAVAVARKNPRVRPAFPALRSPITENTPIGFMLSPCARTISSPHYDMQVQRLFLENAPEICIDDWRDPGFADELADQFSTRISQARTQGKDMVLVLALHHDDSSGQLAAVLEEALQKVLPFERDKSSPRVSGAFVFDSQSHVVELPDLRPLVLWCPSNAPGDDLDTLPTDSQHTCAVNPFQLNIELGPFRFSEIPIFPTRPQYLTYIDKYSETLAGRMTKLTFKAPEQTPLSQHIQVGDFAVATFYNNEILTADPADAFSFCQGDTPVVFRVSITPEPIPIAMLPEVHAVAPQPAYSLGLFWTSPFLLWAEYESYFAGAATAYSFTVPFGISSPGKEFHGSLMWEQGEFSLKEQLKQCTRFCDHPTFDSSVTYNVQALFRDAYRGQCYTPNFPTPGGGGFPHDP